MPYDEHGKLVSTVPMAPGRGAIPITDLGTPWPKDKLTKKELIRIIIIVIIVIVLLITAIASLLIH